MNKSESGYRTRVSAKYNPDKFLVPPIYGVLIRFNFFAINMDVSVLKELPDKKRFRFFDNET